ncbi:MAG: hypothetical protein ACXVH9_03950, partial [Halobacteriota archaeon]
TLSHSRIIVIRSAIVIIDTVSHRSVKELRAFYADLTRNRPNITIWYRHHNHDNQRLSRLTRPH